MTAPPHLQPDWDMHEHGAELTKPHRLAEGTPISGIVVCHHPYGLGVYLEDRDEYGHVNITAIGTGPLRGPQDFPPIGALVNGTVLGYSGQHAQLRIALHRRPSTATPNRTG
jgi:hypothetical protein